MEYRQIGRTDLNVSVLGFGGSSIGGEFGEVDIAEAERAVHAAIDHGINYFDTSPYYGRTLSESRLGEALEGRRDKVVLATKCGRYDVDSFAFSAARIERSIDESLIRLRTDYVDLLQLHDIEFGDKRQIIEETLPAARRIQQAGKARYIGITALPLKIMRDIAEAAPVDAILSYARYNLMVQDLDDILRPLADEQGVGLINASPLHLRILTETGPPDWHLADPEVTAIGRKVAALCRSEGVDIAQLALRFCLDYPHVASTLVGMSKVRHLEANVKAVDFEIDPGLMRKIETLVEPVKNRIWPSGKPENQD